MAKITKEQMVENVRGFMTSTNKAVKEMVEYTMKVYNENPRNLTIADLKDTLDTIKDMLSQGQQEILPLENSLKVKGKNKDKGDNKVVTLKKNTKSEEEALKEIGDILDEDENDEPEEETITKKEDSKKVIKKKKDDAKTDDKKEEPKETKKVTPKEDTNKPLKTFEMLATMPETFDSLIGKLKVRPDIKDIKELHDLVEAGQQLVICVYWNKRQLKQFDYDALGINPSKKVKEFTNDLDIVDIMYASENGLVVYGVSLYTEVATVIRPDGFATDPDTGLRYESGAEYQIYEIIEE